jgi:hypothetical protein
MSGFPVRRMKLSKYKRDGRLFIKQIPQGMGIGQKIVKR